MREWSATKCWRRLRLRQRTRQAPSKCRLQTGEPTHHGRTGLRNAAPCESWRAAGSAPASGFTSLSLNPLHQYKYRISRTQLNHIYACYPDITLTPSKPKPHALIPAQGSGWPGARAPGRSSPGRRRAACGPGPRSPTPSSSPARRVRSPAARRLPRQRLVACFGRRGLRRRRRARTRAPASRPCHAPGGAAGRTNTRGGRDWVGAGGGGGGWAGRGGAGGRWEDAWVLSRAGERAAWCGCGLGR